MTVCNFKRPYLRPSHIASLKAVLTSLSSFKTKGELWIDGSFLTEKPDPRDIDMVLRIRSDEYQTASQSKRDWIDWLFSKEANERMNCHIVDLIEYPRSHSQYPKSIEDRKEWLQWFGTYQDNTTPKGLVAITLIDGKPESWN